MNHHQIFDKHNTTSATSGSRIAYPSGAPGFTLVFMEFVLLTFFIVFYRLFVVFVLFLLAFALSVFLRLMVSDYLFRIFKPFLI